jgi:hypothetical protein
MYISIHVNKSVTRHSKVANSYRKIPKDVMNGYVKWTELGLYIYLNIIGQLCLTILSHYLRGQTIFYFIILNFTTNIKYIYLPTLGLNTWNGKIKISSSGIKPKKLIRILKKFFPFSAPMRLR